MAIIKITMAAVLVWYPFLAIAYDNQALKDELRYLQAEAYTITASKVMENVEKSVATVSVIDDQQIRNMGARNLLDVLRVVPGLGITQSEIGIREIEVRGVRTASTSTKVLLMLNGHPLDHNTQNAGSLYIYDDLPIDDIKRIEVVRGTGSALYGANAFLSVINIITKNASDINGTEITVRGGSFDTQKYNIAFGKDVDGLKVGGNFHYADTNGFDALIKQDSLSLAGQPSKTPGHTDFHEKRYDLSWNGEYKDFMFDGRYINKKTGTFVGFGSFGPNSALEWTDYFFRLGYNHKFSDSLALNSKIHYTSFAFHNIWQVQPSTYFNAEIEDTKLGNDTQLTYQVNDKNTLIAGFFLEEQRQFDPVAQAGPSPKQLQAVAPWGMATNRFIWSMYTQDIWDILDNLRLVAGARYDEYSDFGGTTNPRIGLNWEIVNGYSMRFSYGTAFRAPAFGETTLINNAALLGNPNLKPEKIETLELGFSAHFSKSLQSQLTLYHSIFNDIISQTPVSASAVRYTNAGTAIAQGIEFETKYSFAKNTYLAFNYVFQDAQDQDNRRLANTPKHRANIMANLELSEHVNLYADTLLKGSINRELGDMRNNVDGYGLINTALVLKDVGVKGLETSFSVYNLLDKDYFSPGSIGVPNDLPQAGRAFFGSVKVRF